jgi:hypothetical protein
MRSPYMTMAAMGTHKFNAIQSLMGTGSKSRSILYAVNVECVVREERTIKEQQGRASQSVRDRETIMVLCIANAMCALSS